MLYKVTKDNGKPAHGGSGQWYLPKGKRPGKWMPKIENIQPCERGYHLCKPEHLILWLDEEIWIAEYKGEMIEQDDKIVVQQARLVSRVETWNERNARLFAADCAEHVLLIWEEKYPNDTRPHEAIAVTRAYANGKASKGELSAARDAARSAAWSAAGDAAWYAAWSATWSAAGDAAWYAARDAARSAAGYAAEKKWQTELLFDYLEVAKGGSDD